MQKIRYAGAGRGEKQTKHGKITQIIISKDLLPSSGIEKYQEEML